MSMIHFLSLDSAASWIPVADIIVKAGRNIVGQPLAPGVAAPAGPAAQATGIVYLRDVVRENKYYVRVALVHFDLVRYLSVEPALQLPLIVSSNGRRELWRNLGR